MQLALDKCRVEDSLELSEAFARMKDAHLACSAPVPWRPHGGLGGVYAHLASHDGRSLVIADWVGWSRVGLWNTADRSLRWMIDLEHPVDSMAFSSDDKLLYLGGLDVVRVDAATGRINKQYSGFDDTLRKMALTADGARLVAYGEAPAASLCVCDTATGMVSESIDLPGSHDDSLYFALAPKSKLLVYQKQDRWAMQPLDGEASRRETTEITGRLLRAEFTPDEKLLVTVEEQEPKHPRQARLTGSASGTVPAIVRVRSLAEQLKVTASIQAKGRVEELIVAPAGNHLLVQTTRDSLRLYSLPNLALLKEIRVPEASGLAEWRGSGFGLPLPPVAAISPGQKWLTVSCRQSGRVFSFPDLQLAQQFDFGWCGEPAFFDHDRQVVFASSVPRWFHAHNWQESFPYAGHGGSVLQLQFSADGRTLRSLGTDQQICTWDAATMRMLGRTAPPPGLAYQRICGPDGRYVVCSPAAGDGDVDWYFLSQGVPSRPDADQRSPPSQLKVLDLESGKAVGQFALSLDALVFWIGDRQVVCLDKERWRRISIPEGRLLEERAMDRRALENEFDFSACRLGEDHKTLWFVTHLGGDRRPIRSLPVDVLELTTMKKMRLGELPREHWSHEGAFTLVPGGTYFAIGPQIFDRQTLKFLNARIFRHLHGCWLAFSPKGNRYAAVTSGEMFLEGQQSARWDTEKYGLVHAHDVATGRTLLAFPSWSCWGEVEQVQFSPDERRLAIAESDGRIMVWNLPDIRPTRK